MTFDNLYDSIGFSRLPYCKLQRVVGKNLTITESLFMKSIKNYARWVRFLSIALILIITGLFIRNWLGDLIPGNIMPFGSAVRAMTFWQRLVGMCAAALFGSLLIGALYYCIRLMKRFESGDIFSSTTTALLKKITGFLFWWAVYAPLQRTLEVLLETINNPVGQRVLSLSISSNDIFVIMICLFLHIITAIMQEACTIKAEQDLTV